MEIPYTPQLFDIPINIHLISEYLSFFVGFQFYRMLKKRQVDPIDSNNRLSIILGAAIGAFLGSRIIGFLENPTLDIDSVIQLYNNKTIMGGLFGGLLGVEITKLFIKEKKSSGDLFVFPLMLGIGIGRIGCFLSGVNEFTYGKPTNFFMGMDLGDGVFRHPTSLYEILFLIGLAFVLYQVKQRITLENGTLFKLFMLSYFGFRFIIEFIKPNVFFILHLSSIQWLCITCWLYYSKSIIKLSKQCLQENTTITTSH